MFLPRVLFRTLAPMLVLGLLLGGCIMPARPTEPAAQPPVEPTLAEPEPTAELPAEDLAAVVNQNANVRTGPSTDNPIAYWLAAGDEVTVVGRNAEGTWLRIEHEDRPGLDFRRPDRRCGGRGGRAARGGTAGRADAGTHSRTRTGTNPGGGRTDACTDTGAHAGT